MEKRDTGVDRRSVLATAATVAAVAATAGLADQAAAQPPKPEAKDGSGKLKLTDEQIKRLDNVVQLKEDPLAPFKKLIKYLQVAMLKAQEEKKGEVVFKLKELGVVIPKRTDMAAVAFMMPALYRAKFAEVGFNDPGNSDHNTGDKYVDGQATDRWDKPGD